MLDKKLRYNEGIQLNKTQERIENTSLIKNQMDSATIRIKLRAEPRRRILIDQNLQAYNLFKQLVDQEVNKTRDSMLRKHLNNFDKLDFKLIY